MLRILIVDDHTVVRSGLQAILSREADMEVAGEAETGREAIEAFTRLRPDVTVLDLRLPDMEGSEVIQVLRTCDPSAKILVLSSYGTESDVYDCITAGVMGYVQKGASGPEVIEAIRQVAAGHQALSEAMSLKLAEGASASFLTERDMEVLRELARGHSNREIANAIGVTVPTVKVHLAHIMDKLGANSRSQVLVIALQRGLIRQL